MVLWVKSFRRQRLSTQVPPVVLPPVSGHWGEAGLLVCASVLDRLFRGRLWPFS